MFSIHSYDSYYTASYILVSRMHMITNCDADFWIVAAVFYIRCKIQGNIVAFRKHIVAYIYITHIHNVYDM